MTYPTNAPQPNYFGNSPVMRLLRLGLRASQVVWPAMARRVSYRLFGTPLPMRWRRRRLRWHADWLVETWPFERAGLTVYRRASPTPGPVVLLLHGWGGHAGQLLALAHALHEKGLQAVMLDMPAHGRSLGGVSNLAQFARAVDYAAARLRQQGHALHAVVAHSLGANAAAFAASRGLAVQGLVLLAPPASPHEYTRLFARMFGLSEDTRAALQGRLEAREGILMPQFEPASVGPRIHVPTLVVHDRGDRVNPFANGQAYSRAIVGAELLATEGVGHTKLLKDPGVLASVAAFAANLPSAA